MIARDESSVGTVVRVQLQRPDDWTRWAKQELDDRLGVVEEFDPINPYGYRRERPFLVRLVPNGWVPPRKGQRSASAWHFGAEDLVPAVAL